MKLRKMLRDCKTCKKYTEGDYIKWSIKFYVDDESYFFHFLPTIVWQPYPYRLYGMPVIDIPWFNLHILIGEWINGRKMEVTD